jgi:hypothetical protein
LIGRRRDLRDLRRNFDLDNHPPSNGPITLAVLPPKRTNRPPCALCEQAPADCRDPHVGPVCASCYAELIHARIAMQKLGPKAGIGDCREK